MIKIVSSKIYFSKTLVTQSSTLLHSLYFDSALFQEIFDWFSHFE